MKALIARPARAVQPALRLPRRRSVPVLAESLPRNEQAEPHSRAVETAAAAIFASSWWDVDATPLARTVISEPQAAAVSKTPSVTLKTKLTDMQSYQMFLGALDKKVRHLLLRASQLWLRDELVNQS